MRFLLAVLTCLMLSPAFAQDKPDLVEVVEINGVINEFMAVTIASQVDAINDNPKIRAVVLVVDTPGGGASASAAIYESLSKIKVPVVAWCNYLCASGGIYVLMAPSVKYIGVRQDTISGSVGVIAQMARFHRLLDFVKIDVETYKSGRLKDAGNPTRAGQEEERKYLQSIIDELAERFYGIVAKARPGIKDWDEVKTGKVFIGNQAVKVGLVDAIASRDQVIKKAKELSGAKLIFTRDEIRKMSRVADAPHTVHQAPRQEVSPFGDIPWLISLLKEIRAGESVQFSYRMDYGF